MAGDRRSDISYASDLGEEFDRIHIQDSYELQHVSPITTSAQSQQRGFGEVDAGDSQQLLADQPVQEPARTEQRLLSRIDSFLQVHDPRTANGRQQIKRTIRRSGTIRRVNTDPREWLKDSERFKWLGEGWRLGVACAIGGVVLCLFAELVLLVCALTLNKAKNHAKDIGTIYTGSCRKVEVINTILAIPLNIIATVLVATSNYVMQCLSAPTRKDVDRAHARGSYLNIGISSVHNLFYVKFWKSFLWLSLVITTVPIHLLLNSAFFGALQANNYGVMLATEGWVSDQDFEGALQDTNLFNTTDIGVSFVDHFVFSMWQEANRGHLKRLPNDECFKTYSKQLQSRSSNIVLVTKDTTISSYSINPQLESGLSDEEALLNGYYNPWTIFKVPESMGMTQSSVSGNSMPMLNYTQKHAILPANVSGGLYPLTGYDNAPALAPVKSVFTAFDYHYWAVIKHLAYDFNNSDILKAGQWNPTSWMCPMSEVVAGHSCTSGGKAKVPQPWLVTPQNFEVDHCLSQETEEQCSLQYSFAILIIVICCDIAKILAMAAALFFAQDKPLATIGDAIASFVDRPDISTTACCLMQQNQARSLTSAYPLQWLLRKLRFEQTYQHANQTFAERMGPAASKWHDSITRWSSVPSKSRWTAFALLYIGLLASSTAVLAIGVKDLQALGITTPFTQGFGSINPNTIFAYPSAFTAFGGNNGTAFSIQRTNKQQALFADVITVNTPQLLFSTLYFLYNGLFTTMVTANEWSKFASERKALRVSEPRKGQRSTYWLQLPWKYSVPLLIIATLIHWLVSRSLFIVRINVFGWAGKEQQDRDISACGYSPLAILVAILLVVLSLIVVLIAGRKKLRPGIPVCGTNSLAIAAACHYEYDREGGGEVALHRLAWGVIEEPKGEKPGHCGMSDRDVGTPVPGLVYK